MFFGGWLFQSPDIQRTSRWNFVINCLHGRFPLNKDCKLGAIRWAIFQLLFYIFMAFRLILLLLFFSLIRGIYKPAKDFEACHVLTRWLNHWGRIACHLALTPSTPYETLLFVNTLAVFRSLFSKHNLPPVNTRASQQWALQHDVEKGGLFYTPVINKVPFLRTTGLTWEH